MSGLIAFLQSELLSLSSEAKRKHPEIKEAAERTSAVLRTFKERPGHNVAEDLTKTDEVLRPFLLACETKQVKLVVIAIGCIQKLITFNAIPEQSVNAILKTLNDIMIHGVEIQLKILQTILPLLTNYHTIHGDVLAEALLICFRLQDSKVVVVNNTAAATLRQLVIHVFDKVAKEDAILAKGNEHHDLQPRKITISPEETIELYPSAADAYYLFQDLCLLTNGEATQFLRLHHLSRTFGLELIESVLTNHIQLFKSHPDMTVLLKEKVCPLIIKTFSDKHDFPQTMRLTRVIYILVKQFSNILIMETEIFLSMFVKVLEPDHPLWQRVLAMEIFRGVCADPTLIRSIYNWYDKQASSTDIFQDMITGFGRLAAEKPQLLGVNQGGRESLDSGQGSYLLHSSSQNLSAAEPGLSTSASTMRIQCIDQLDKADPPSIPETYLYYLALVCLNTLADGMAGYVLPIFASGSHKLNGSMSASTADDHHLGKDTVSPQKDDPDVAENIVLVTDMATVAWPGLLAAMSFYLSAKLDEDLFQAVMRSYQNFTNVCGALKLTVPRDAFLTNLCRNAVPTIPMISTSRSETNIAGSSSSLSTLASGALSYSELSAQQQQMLANIALSEKNLYCLRVLLNVAMFLGNMLDQSWYLVLETLQQADFLLFSRPSQKGSSSSNPPTPVRRQTSTLTLSTATHLSPQQAAQAAANATADADHITLISASMGRIFDNTKYLDDGSFVAFTKALCRMSSEASGAPFSDTDATLGSNSSKAKLFNNKSFAVEKLRFIATLNMERLINPKTSFTAWDIIVKHLITTANYPFTPSAIRAQTCESISDIVISAMNVELSTNKDDHEKVQLRLLSALSQCIIDASNPPVTVDTGDQTGGSAYMSRTSSEAQKMALETLNRLLQMSGHSLSNGWSLVFDMLTCIATGANILNETGNDDGTLAVPSDADSPKLRRASSDMMASTGSKASMGLVRIAFSSLQLICTDFLSLLNPDSLRQCIATLGCFSTQKDDLNISLTAVGLLWNVSDFILTKKQELEKSGVGEEEASKNVTTADYSIDKKIEGEATPRRLNNLWMLLLFQLSKVCIDSRPEVRNGANQTLFRTIGMNGDLLNIYTWHACVWEILFPLLNDVKLAAIDARNIEENQAAAGPSDTDRESVGFMMHHSRNTAEKQWDETKVLVLLGTSGIFHDFLDKLTELEDFSSAWILLLAHFEDSTLRSGAEVSLASIKSLKNITTLAETEKDTSKMELWQKAWQSWERIGLGIANGEQTNHSVSISTIADSKSLTTSLEVENLNQISDSFTQDTLITLANTFTDLYPAIKSEFGLEEVQRLLRVLRELMIYSSSPQYRPDIDHLSPLQEAILDALCSIDMTVDAVAAILNDLADYMSLAFLSPNHDSLEKLVSATPIPPSQRKHSTVTYIALNKKCTKLVLDIFKRFSNELELYQQGVYVKVIAALGIPMKLKYDCPPSFKHYDEDTPALWKSATTALLEILDIGLPKVREFESDIPLQEYESTWRAVVEVLEGSLLSQSSPPSTMSIEELDIDEHFDIKLLTAVENNIVLQIGHAKVPTELIRKLIDVIKEGSRLYYVDEQANDSTDDKPGDMTSMNRSSDLLATVGTIVPVMKETFAYAALRCLFSLCSSDKQDQSEVRQRIAEVSAPVLLDRCEVVLRNYMADQPLLGRCPFPRVRNEETLFILRQLLFLEMRPNLLNQEGDDDIKKLLLGSSRAQIFYLYPTLCKTMVSQDAAVVALIGELLEVAGQAMGLCPKDDNK
ncbi:hypothetical protein K450DRAFT_272753 [Umbelopsis ramanniana AG]|uniref:Endosomal peripheral membrane protein n=1 Tax=Umbelopsis ramanniana AG TaxID=1314678 RepID=A0AAD5E8Y6_UMBRA|nr:uncharacterized protein K450DRAFT_272753 [Umbelopsis ramanniana AG]KAI8578525.1 hypothetical protein K450DRAFT_272753 [Umbelopsis ramanniana AG]